MCQAPWRSYLEVYCDVRERWLLAWNQNKHIIYYIFHILILKSVLVFHVFHTIAPTLFDDSNFIIARLQSVIFQLPFFGVCHGMFVDINHFGAIMVLLILSEADFRSFHFHFHHPRCLADSSCMVKVVQQPKDCQQQFQRKKCVSIKN